MADAPASGPDLSADPAPSQNLAYDCNDIDRIITVVFIGALTDDDVLAFYRRLLRHCPAAPDYDFLLDRRYTSWTARAETVAAIDALFEDANRLPGRRVAVVRKSNAALTEQMAGEPVRQGIGARVIRHFDSLTVAHDWLTGRCRV